MINFLHFWLGHVVLNIVLHGTPRYSIHVATSRLLWLITYVLRGPSADGIPFQVDLSTSRSKSKSTSRPTTMQPVYSYFVSLSEGGIYDIGTEILLL